MTFVYKNCKIAKSAFCLPFMTSEFFWSSLWLLATLPAVSLFRERRRLTLLLILPYRDSSLLNSVHMLMLAITLKPHQVYSWL